jgi:hypothetical protein
VQARIDEAVAGLKKTNADLKKEKSEAVTIARQLQEQFEALGGEDGIKGLVDMRQRLEKDETGKLLAEGKSEEWFEKRSEAMRKDYERKLEAQAAEIAKRDEALQTTSGRLHSTLLDVGINAACDKAEVKDPWAREHIKLLAEKSFTYDPEHDRHVIRDRDGEVKFGKDNKPMDMAEWIEGHRGQPEYRAWWGETRGSGMGNGALPSSPDRRMELMGNMSLDEYRKARGVER